MLISFTIDKSRETLQEQWLHLVQRGRYNKRLSLKQFSVTLLVSSGLYLVLYFLTPMDNFIELKAVFGIMIALAWLALAIRLLMLVLNKLRDKRQLQKFLSSITDEQLSYQVQIDADKVTITSTSYAYEFPWTVFNQFGIHKETLYVFNAASPVNSLYWNRTEMGSEAYLALLDLLKSKSVKQTF